MKLLLKLLREIKWIRPYLHRLKRLKFQWKRRYSFGRPALTKNDEQTRERAISVEATFWEGITAFNANSKWRNDPEEPFQENLRQLVLNSKAADSTTLRILDVGAGPLTSVGKKWPGRQLEIVAVDPLAELYANSQDQHGVKPLVRTLFGEGEKLLDQFEENTFDLAVSFNALDHSVDPILCIQNLIKVVKPSCHVYLWHFENEAEKENYHGMHQWNFYEEHGELFLSNRSQRFQVSAILSGVETMISRSGNDRGGYVETSIKKQG